MTTDLSETEARIVAFIDDYRARNHTGPSYEDVGKHLGVSKSTAWKRVQDLIWKGSVEIDPELYRTLRTTGAQQDFWEFTLSNGSRLLVKARDYRRARLVAQNYLSSRTDIAYMNEGKKLSMSIGEALAGREIDAEILVVVKEEDA